MYYYNNQLPPQQGWICPKCGRVNAPWLPTCGCVSSQTSGYVYVPNEQTEKIITSYTTSACTYGKWRTEDERTCYTCLHYMNGVGCQNREMYHTERSE